MGHYASEMGMTRVTPEWEQWGFIRVPFANYDSIIECPLCHAAVVKGYSDTKEDSKWWAHIQWHRLIQDKDSTFGFHWPFQP